jgi:hypothetical protein
MKYLLAVMVGSLGILSFSGAEEDSCKVNKGVLSSLPMPCEGTVIILRNPEYCGSCVVQEQSMSKAPKTLDDITGFFSDETIWVGGGSAQAQAQGLKAKGATCVGEKGEKLSSIEYVRRREFCRELAESKHVPAGRQVEGTRSELDWIKKSAASYAQRDRERIQSLGGDEIQKKMNERAEKFKLDHHCMLGVKAIMKKQLPWTLDPFSDSSNQKLSRVDAEKETIALQKFSKVVKSGVKLSEISKNYARYFDPVTADVVKTHVDQTLNKFEDLSRNWGSFCGEPSSEVLTLIAEERDIELTIPVTAYFANSASVLDSKKADAMKAEIQGQILKNPEIARCGGGLTSVDVYASSNKLANGDPYGKWDFQQLSQDRANFVRDQVLGTLEDPLLKGFNFKEKANVLLGDRNSGASGACPYKTTGPEEGPLTVVLDSKYTQKGSKERLEMESAKKVQVALRFKSRCKSSVTERPNLQILAGNCVQPEFSCNGR